MRQRKGMTVVELLIVVSLVAMFAALSYATWSHQLGRSRDSRRKADLSEWMTALYGYYDDSLCFPEEEMMRCGSDAMRPYMDEVPCDPANNARYHYRYVREGCQVFYVYTRLEVESDPLIARIGCDQGCGPESERGYNYYVTSGDAWMTEGSGGGSPMEPTCGTVTRYCFPGQCSACCPGVGYRCNAAGDRCLVDLTCG